ncbi:MAG: hypothetical protein M1820_007103 [Bogoriella megaspora]|nr:MAG: hypothetical protein M1820_007103 [Bogoriella megaspora]
MADMQGIDKQAIFDIWANANFLFHNLALEEALAEYKRLVKVCRLVAFQAVIFINMGITRCLLGEYFLAGQDFRKSIELEGRLAITWFLYATTKYHLHDPRKAHFYFERCLNFFKNGENSINYRPLGLDFLLKKEHIEQNLRTAAIEIDFIDTGNLDIIKSDAYCDLNYLPAGLIVEPQGLNTSTETQDGMSQPNDPPASTGRTRQGSGSDIVNSWTVSGKSGIRKQFKLGADMPAGAVTTAAGSDIKKTEILLPAATTSDAAKGGMSHHEEPQASMAGAQYDGTVESVVESEHVRPEFVHLKTKGLQSPSLFVGVPTPLRMNFARTETLLRLEGDMKGSAYLERLLARYKIGRFASKV